MLTRYLYVESLQTICLSQNFPNIILNKSVGPDKCVGKKMHLNGTQKLFLIYYLDKRIDLQVL